MFLTHTSVPAISRNNESTKTEPVRYLLRKPTLHGGSVVRNVSYRPTTFSMSLSLNLPPLTRKNEVSSQRRPLDSRRNERLELASRITTIKDPIQSRNNATEKDGAREWKKRKEKEGQGRDSDIAVARDALSAVVRRRIGAGKRNLPEDYWRTSTRT